MYAVPLERQLTVIGDDEEVPVKQPGVETAVYALIALPPMQDGAVNATDADAFAPVAVPIVGAFGALRGS